jgi:hypothetical protein
LQAGAYECFGEAVFSGDASLCRARIQNISDGTTVAQGTNEQGSLTGGTNGHATVQGRFVIASLKTFELQIYPKISTTAAAAVSSGDSEVYAIFEFRKLAV